jgi:alkane 1-monooxygenase
MKARTESWQIVVGSYFSYLLFVLYVFAVIFRGSWLLLPAALIIVVVPILDSVSRQDLTLNELALSRVQQSLIEAAPALFVLGNAATIAITAHIFRGLTLEEKLFAVLSVGMIGSIGITAAHELVHKTQRLSKTFGRLGLANVFYLHFEINHIRGHHVRVGTQEDKSTAWFGESVYHFFFRTVPGCFKLSWELENERLARRGTRLLSFENQMFQFAFLQGLYVAAVWFLGGWSGVGFFILQACISVFMLESVAYIEHYGLLRAKRVDGKYEPMSPTDSWDCYGRFSNYLVFQLQRHADHHSHPTRAFSNLRTAVDAPNLPLGYPLLIGMAMVPTLWRKVMDPRVTAAQSEKRRRQSDPLLRTLEV